ncbi:MAG TPA: SURF1 family protein [Stellaceae bacterium]|nr:SURF1 family protein [Stellaceae bacterium]
MRRRLVKLTLVSLSACAALIALGTWQVERLHWKEGLIAARAAALAAPPIDLPGSLDAARGLEFRRVRVSGVFDYAHEFPVNATERDSGKAGDLLVTPLRRADGSVVLVERGWIPWDLRDPATRAAGNPPGIVEVEGLLRIPDGKPSWFVPDNDPTRNQWFYIDPAAMSRAAGATEVLPFYVEAGPAPHPGGYPLGGQAHMDLPNNHLQYAITWYSLAGVLVVIYLLLVRRERAAPENPTVRP